MIFKERLFRKNEGKSFCSRKFLDWYNHHQEHHLSERINHVKEEMELTFNTWNEILRAHPALLFLILMCRIDDYDTIIVVLGRN